MSALVSTKPFRPVHVRQAAYAAEPHAYRSSVLTVLCAIAIAICFWYTVPFKSPLQLDPDPMKAAADQAAAYAGSMSRQIAVPLIALISGYAIYRLPKAASSSRLSRLCVTALAYESLSRDRRIGAACIGKLRMTEEAEERIQQNSMQLQGVPTSAIRPVTAQVLRGPREILR